jgi:hypothetical protein
LLANRRLSHRLSKRSTVVGSPSAPVICQMSVIEPHHYGSGPNSCCHEHSDSRYRRLYCRTWSRPATDFAALNPSYVATPPPRYGPAGH